MESDESAGAGASPTGAARPADLAPSPARAAIRFLRHEICLTSGLLSELSAVLSEELATLSAAPSGCAGSISRMIEAVQGEDLAQQRLMDIAAALGAPERAIDGAGPAGADAGGDLGRQVAAQLRLGETRARLAWRLDGQTGAHADPAPAPRAGEVDLF